MTGPALELLTQRDGNRVQLCSPGVGVFTAAVPAGQLLGPGAEAGRLVTLGLAQALIVPAGTAGVVRVQPHERVHAPVGYGTVLYELEALGEGTQLAPEETQADGVEPGALVVRAPQAGRFYHRAAPASPPLASPGRVLETGTPVGLIEVMKTFTHVVYSAGGGLPQKARITRVLTGDGADVGEGDALMEIEPT